MEEPLFHQKCLLQKFEGKGGWTFAELPGLPSDGKKPFGWVQVRGTVDGYPLKQYKLMPMGNGKLFLPVKAEIRKKTGKKAGDWVEVVLFADDSPVEIPEELLLCLLDAPEAHAFFQTLTDSNRKYYIDWIMDAKTLETKANRIAKAIERLEKGLRMYDKAFLHERL